MTFFSYSFNFSLFNNSYFSCPLILTVLDYATGMKTIIISSTISGNSNLLLLCNAVSEHLSKKGVNVKVISADTLDLVPYGRGGSDQMTALKEDIIAADNIIFGMAVYNYSINDGLKIIIDNCCEGATEKFFGILCAAGGEKSYLATQHLTQICMNQWRMIQLPRVIYATENDFSEEKIINPEIKKRLDIFSKEFFTIGNKLLK